MPNKPHNKNHSQRRRNPRHKKDFQDRDRAPTFTDEDTISKSDLEGKDVLSLPELRKKSITQLQATAEEMNIENIKIM